MQPPGRLARSLAGGDDGPLANENHKSHVIADASEKQQDRSIQALISMHVPNNIFEAAQALRTGDCTPLDLVERCLERIARYEESVKAWVSVDGDQARQTARELVQTKSSATTRSPLWGIPLGIKDVFDVAGQPTQAGSPMRKDHRAAADSFAVQKLREAGAILLGKTVTTEFACFDPPPTRNPWDTSRTPGGSSSGSAAALALGMCLGALGTQTGGSIIRPASYCGMYGLKPTFGRVSFAGVVGVTTHLDHAGPMARSVRDLAILFEAMAGCDPHDPLTSRRDVPQCLEAIAAGTAQAPRLGRIGPYFFDEADQAIATTTDAALAHLKSAGASITTAKLPASFARVREMHRRIMVVEALALHRETFPARRDAYGPNIASLLDEGLPVSAVAYADAVRHQKCFLREILAVFESADVLAMPATDCAAPFCDSTGSPKFQSPWSYAGLPAGTIPCGLTDAGLPAGLQLVGRPFQEDALLATAAWCEERLGFGAQPKMLNQG